MGTITYPSKGKFGKSTAQKVLAGMIYVSSQQRIYIYIYVYIYICHTWIFLLCVKIVPFHSPQQNLPIWAEIYTYLELIQVYVL